MDIRFTSLSDTSRSHRAQSSESVSIGQEITRKVGSLTGEAERKAGGTCRALLGPEPVLGAFIEFGNTAGLLVSLARAA
ncbi:unnamed protein product, partial [Mycena citricolor]